MTSLTIYTRSKQMDQAWLWRSPSSPPFKAATTAHFIQVMHSTGDEGTDNISKKPSSNDNDSNVINGAVSASSPSSPFSDFEFDCVSTAEGKDDPPVSPKLIASWMATAAPATATRVVPKKQASGNPPLSPSVRQLMADDMLDAGDNIEHTSHRCVAAESPGLLANYRSHTGLASRSESHSHTNASASSSTSSSSSAGASDVTKHIDSEDLAGSQGRLKKQGKSGKRWPFKDFLRRTVASSKPDQGTSSGNGARPFTVKLNYSVSAPIMSPPSSPPRSPLEQYYDAVSTPRSPTPSSTPRRSTMMTTSRIDGRPSTTMKTVYMGPSKTNQSPPMSPHTQHQLSKKTFLPYRRSLLAGCLGSFPPEQQVW